MFKCFEEQGYRILYKNNSEMNCRIYALKVTEIRQEAASFQTKMQEDRYQRMMKFRNEIDKKRMIGCEILFQIGLRQQYPHIRQPVVIKTDRAGKPYLDGHEDICFNMSHAGDYAVCAFAKYPIGVDIEFVKPINLTIAESYFCREEYEDIMKYDLGGQLKRFYQYWVLKESFTKAVGLGLSIPLNKFCFRKKYDSDLINVKHEINKNDYLAEQFSFIEAGYEMAVCIQGK